MEVCASHFQHSLQGFSISVKIERASAGRGRRKNLFRETKLLGANGDTGEKVVSLCTADHEQNWQSSCTSVDPYST